MSMMHFSILFKFLLFIHLCMFYDYFTTSFQLFGDRSEHLRTIISFYACVLLGSVQKKQHVTEKTNHNRAHAQPDQV